VATREEITQNLATLHAHQNRRARWVWVALTVFSITVFVVAYRALDWTFLPVGQH
jgi:hypothetical protein